MELVEDLGAEVNKYSQRNEYMNIVLQYRSRLSTVSHSLTVSNNQVYSNNV